MALKALVAAVLAFGLVVAGCGGDDSDASTEDYQSALDGLCADQTALLQKLPQRQADEELTTDEIQEIADGYADDFRAKVDELEPPSDLEDTHDELVETIAVDPDPDASPDEIIGIYEELEGIYTDLGATGCATGVTQSIEQFSEAIENLPPATGGD